MKKAYIFYSDNRIYYMHGSTVGLIGLFDRPIASEVFVMRCEYISRGYKVLVKSVHECSEDHKEIINGIEKLL